MRELSAASIVPVDRAAATGTIQTGMTDRIIIKSAFLLRVTCGFGVPTDTPPAAIRSTGTVTCDRKKDIDEARIRPIEDFHARLEGPPARQPRNL